MSNATNASATATREYRLGYLCGVNGGFRHWCPEFSGMDAKERREQWLAGFSAGFDRKEVARVRRFR